MKEIKSHWQSPQNSIRNGGHSEIINQEENIKSKEDSYAKEIFNKINYYIRIGIIKSEADYIDAFYKKSYGKLPSLEKLISLLRSIGVHINRDNLFKEIFVIQNPPIVKEEENNTNHQKSPTKKKEGPNKKGLSQEKINLVNKSKIKQLPEEEAKKYYWDLSISFQEECKKRGKECNYTTYKQIYKKMGWHSEINLISLVGIDLWIKNKRWKGLTGRYLPIEKQEEYYYNLKLKALKKFKDEGITLTYNSYKEYYNSFGLPSPRVLPLLIPEIWNKKGGLSGFCREIK